MKHHASARRDFNRSTLAKLTRVGVTLTGIAAIPGAGPFAFANSTRGYTVADNGTGRVWKLSQVLEAAQ